MVPNKEASYCSACAPKNWVGIEGGSSTVYRNSTCTVLKFRLLKLLWLNWYCFEKKGKLWQKVELNF